MPVDLSDFKARLPIVEIVARYVRLTRAGPLWRGLCPFHQEKTPSFTVTESRGTYHCFGCEAHGNALDFLMAIEGLGFAEAVRRAGELTGLEPPAAAPPDPALARARGLIEVLEAANALFREFLERGPDRAAAAYVARRGLDETTVARFELGAAPDGRARLTQALQARGIALGDLVAAGLTVVPEDGGAPFDRFRDRLMFPIRDGRGRLAGFGGRALREGAGAKYLNSAEGPLFKKRELLYGAHLWDRRAGRGALHVVEGYMDVITLAQHGIAAVAPLGTATTPEQVRGLWRLDPAPIVCLDGDAAGERAAGRLAERALGVLRPGCTLRFALLPAGEDPDSLVRAGGAAALTKLGARPVALASMLWRHLGGDRVDAAPEERALLRRRLREIVATIPDADVRREYGREFRRFLDADRTARFAREAGAVARPGSGRMRLAEPASGYELLVPLLQSPGLLDRFHERIAALRFATGRFERLRDFLLDCALAPEELTEAAIVERAREQGMEADIDALRRWKMWPRQAALGEEERQADYELKLAAHERHRARDEERARCAPIWGHVDAAESGAQALDGVLNAPLPE